MMRMDGNERSEGRRDSRTALAILFVHELTEVALNGDPDMTMGWHFVILVGPIPAHQGHLALVAGVDDVHVGSGCCDEPAAAG